MNHRLLERARATGTPLIDGETVTFLYQGDEQPFLLGELDSRAWFAGPRPMERIAGDVWTYTATFPHDAYVEYRFQVDGIPTLDPLNPNTTFNGVDHWNNTFFMPEAEDTPLAVEAPDVPRGAIIEEVLHVPYFIVGGERTVRFYRPPADGPHPLLVVWDGQDYLTRAHLPTIVDNLIAQRRIAPIALAMIDHGDGARIVEYSCNDATFSFLSRSVIPAARECLDLAEPSDRRWGLLGASMGGLISLYVAMRAPELFGIVISQSGAFGHAGNETVLGDMIRHFPPRDLSIWMDVGILEGGLTLSRRMRALLIQMGYPVTYREYHAGHNYTAWKNDVWRTLEAVFPP